MASVSVPAPVTSSPAFTPYTLPSPPAPLAHARKHSRNPNAVQLPAFSFNPGGDDKAGASLDENVQSSDDVASSSSGLRKQARPPPLPDFTFNPGAKLPVDDRPSPTHPVLEEMALNQQRVTRSARPAPLPAFTFAPGGVLPAPSPSPSRAEFGDSSQSRAATGHKRAGSEFVGGGTDGPTLINTSPQRHEARPSGPPVTNAGRRGHVHRRSQAVSITDIETSDLIKAHAVAKSRTNSQPSTPIDIGTGLFGTPHSPKSRPLPRSLPSSPQRRESTPTFRPRVVEFADKIDVIPRPLSMISSETEGSISTIRYGHSLTNSINSIASPTKIPTIVSSPPSEESPRQRPKTADPSTLLSFSNSSPERSLSVINLPKRPLSSCGSPSVASSGSPPVKKKHFWFSHSPDRTPTGTPQAEIADPLANLKEFAPEPSSDKVRPRTSPERSVSTRRKKHHPWTGVIFSKKSKHRASKAKPKRTPTPPSLQRRTSDKVNEIFDADSTIVLRSDSPAITRTEPKIDTGLATSLSQMEDISSPVLDLDAALGPFGSEERLSVDHGSQRTTSRISKLHSSERRGVVDAFGTVHRRAESAPSMPAFNRNAFGIHRHGSNPSIAEEVFDEEEEDIFLAGEKKVSKPPIDRMDSAASEPILSTRFGPEQKRMDGLGLSNLSRPSDAVVIVNHDEDVAPNDTRSSKSTIEAPVLVEEWSKRPVSSPMSFAYPSTQSHYASSTEGRTTTSASMISSPDPEHLHFDHAIRHARSFGEPGPDFFVRPSNDDLPSLSDSISSGPMPRMSSSGNTQCSSEGRDQRSASMFIPGTSRSNQSQNWKRSSLASLNRLIPGSSHGSKLKFETTPETVSEEKQKKKTNRLSKLVNFWRPKEKADQQ